MRRARIIRWRPAAALACLAGAAAALPVPGARAAYPGANGTIVFTARQSSGQEALDMRAAGRTRAIFTGSSLGDPVFSPLGRRIAVTRELPASGRAVWIFNADGTGARQLTDSALAGEQPTWSPSGQQVAYAAGPHGQRTIHAIAANGNADRPLTTGPGDQYDPAWSRRGVIAFVQDNPAGADIYTVPATGGIPRRLTSKPGNDVDPAWGPYGRQLAFVRDRGGIWVMNADGSHAHRVVHVRGGVEQGVAWSPDGNRLVFAGGPAGRRQIFSVDLHGRHRQVLSLPRSNGSDPDWGSAGHDPIIAAAGDIACAPTGASFNDGLGTQHYCGMRRTSNLLMAPDLWDVLALGDLQYPDGDLGRFYQSFDPSWGRIKSLLRPVPGNHEYVVPHAAGYFDYFDGAGAPGGQAGSRARGGYYSYDVGTWHIVALNSNCSFVPGGCDFGSPQQRWLAADLLAHPARCTLAYWHHPLFSSLASAEGRGTRQTAALWQTLYAADADVVLAGHQHFYERMQPMNATGALDPVHGIRSFVVGTGGKNIDQADFRATNSAVFNASTFGILELTLHPDSYSWRFRPASADPFSDSGTARCH